MCISQHPMQAEERKYPKAADTITAAHRVITARRPETPGPPLTCPAQLAPSPEASCAMASGGPSPGHSQALRALLRMALMTRWTLNVWDLGGRVHVNRRLRVQPGLRAGLPRSEGLGQPSRTVGSASPVTCSFSSVTSAFR